MNGRHIALASLAPYFQELILEKLNYRDFSTFERCNQMTKQLCIETPNSYHAFPLKELWLTRGTWCMAGKGKTAREETPPLPKEALESKAYFISNQINIIDPLTDEACEFLIHRARSDLVQITGPIVCSVDSFNRMVDAILPKYLVMCLPSHFTYFPYMTDRVHVVVVTNIGNFSLPALLSINAVDTVHLDGFSVDKLIPAIIELMKGGYSLTNKSIEFDRDVSIEEIERIMSGFGELLEPMQTLVEYTHAWSIRKNPENNIRLFIVRQKNGQMILMPKCWTDEQMKKNGRR